MHVLCLFSAAWFVQLMVSSRYHSRMNWGLQNTCSRYMYNCSNGSWHKLREVPNITYFNDWSSHNTVYKTRAHFESVEHDLCAYSTWQIMPIRCIHPYNLNATTTTERLCLKLHEQQATRTTWATCPRRNDQVARPPARLTSRGPCFPGRDGLLSVAPLLSGLSSIHRVVHTRGAHLATQPRLHFDDDCLRLDVV